MSHVDVVYGDEVLIPWGSTEVHGRVTEVGTLRFDPADLDEFVRNGRVDPVDDLQSR